MSPDGHSGGSNHPIRPPSLGPIGPPDRKSSGEHARDTQVRVDPDTTSPIRSVWLIDVTLHTLPAHRSHAGHSNECRTLQRGPYTCRVGDPYMQEKPRRDGLEPAPTHVRRLG